MVSRTSFTPGLSHTPHTQNRVPVTLPGYSNIRCRVIKKKGAVRLAVRPFFWTTTRRLGHLRPDLRFPRDRHACSSARALHPRRCARASSGARADLWNIRGCGRGRGWRESNDNARVARRLGQLLGLPCRTARSEPGRQLSSVWFFFGPQCRAAAPRRMAHVHGMSKGILCGDRH